MPQVQVFVSNIFFKCLLSVTCPSNACFLSVLSQLNSGDSISTACHGERDFAPEAKDLLSVVEVFLAHLVYQLKSLKLSNHVLYIVGAASSLLPSVHTPPSLRVRENTASIDSYRDFILHTLMHLKFIHINE